jgi:hypothetical protein
MTTPKTIIPVRVHPNAARNEIVAFADGILRVKIAAPPVRDRANKELLDFLCQRLALGKDRVSIIKGHTARNKLVAIDGLSQESVLELLIPGQGT